MKLNDLILRPKEITCDVIWELYKLLEGLKNRYLWVDQLETAEKNEKLMFLQKLTLGVDDVIYDVLDDVEFADTKLEWLELTLKDIENGKSKKYYSKIKVNAIHKQEISPEELLERNKLRIADESDIENAVFEEEESYNNESGPRIPVNDYPIQIRRDIIKMGQRAGAMARNLKDYLKAYSIPFREDIDLGVKRFTFVFMCEKAPGGFTEGCIWFFDKAAEVRVYYNELATDICRKSKYKSELFRLLNYINARVFMEESDGGNKWYEPQILHTPRIYLTEDEGDDITITTMINYRFWKEARLETEDYITAYCPELLDRLAPFIFDMLKGRISVQEAISGINKELFDN
ncbi:MAG: hypothetical protein K6E10_10440 [Eubacterium sp.]|nr:hypothetical protein [Eubacterium sp.]